MSWFNRREGLPESVALALVVGELKAEVAALKAQVADLKKPLPVPETIKDLSPLVRGEIQRLSQGHAELHRHLEQEARALLADKQDDTDIITALRKGG